MHPAEIVVFARLSADRLHGRGRRRWLAFVVLLMAIACIAPAGSAAPAEPASAIRGLPLTRYYPFEEIGDVSRGARLSFDRFGRLGVLQDGSYSVLNDATWVELAERNAGGAPMQAMITGADGHTYYGCLGNWGRVERTARGRLRTRSLVPANAPGWIATSNMTELVGTRTGVYFAGWNGVAYLDFATHATAFIPVPELSRAFALGDQVFVAPHNRLIQAIDLATRTIHPVPGTDFDGFAVDQVASLGNGHALISTIDGRIYDFDGTHVRPWNVALGADMNDRVTAIRPLVDGGVAVAVSGRGLFLVSPQRDVTLALDSPAYHRVTDLATREPGVLWVETESGVEKILYGGPVTLFGQRLGLPVSWPQVVRWHDHVYVISGGRLYECQPSNRPGGASRFELVRHQPPPGAWAVAADGTDLLVGNPKGVYANENGHFTQVLDMDTARLVLVPSGICYAIGKQIAVLRRTDGTWKECAPRVPGFGYPSIVHPAGNSAWIELGPNRAARVTLQDGRLQTRLFDQFPWPDPRWINIGVVGDTVILSGPNSGRLFFDEKTGRLTTTSPLEALLDRAPYWIDRIQEDEQGTLWAAYDHGLFTITRSGGREQYDTSTFDAIHDRIPLIQLLPGGDVWLSSGQTLYHVDRRSGGNQRHAFRPILISLADARTNRDLFQGDNRAPTLGSIPYVENSLSFRFFAGSYASRRPPVYEYRINRGGGEWATLGTGSVLNFPELREGDYHVDVRLTDPHGPIGVPLSLNFTILPPWYRTWYAYLACGLALALAIVSLVRWSVQRTHARNVVLERLVERRTNELRETMEKLNEETRNAATLAERGRLAGEIHDSLQQGLSGLMLNLDSTLKLPGLTSEIRSRLHVARNMVSFTRHEVQQTIWGLESPLLEGAELGDALRRMTSLINSGTAPIDVALTGDAVPLGSAIKHHLLRIAQEGITNAVRHSGAERITVRLDYAADAVTLQIVDDGQGFDPDSVLARGIEHFGLRGLRGRATKIGGKLTIESAPGRGTSIRVTVPTTATPPPEPHATSRAI
ncbi:MAG TPA: ATP-binding protein [Opitutaceae bacterium]|nr:ATP-binding protein [Opitutaceae bacterium]